MLRVFHPCRFNFADEDVRVDGSTITGGTSLSGFEDVIRVDGGGIWRADYTGGDFGNRDDAGRAETMEWRAFNAAMLGGSATAIVRFCDRHHQPIGPAFTVPGTTYATAGAAASVVSVVNGQAGGLRATVLDIDIVSERPLDIWARFTHTHPAWGERAYEIYDVQSSGRRHRVTIQPPIRGGIAAGDPLDFDDVRCRMRRTSPASNALSGGVFSSGSISFVEDMRPPA
jgi:hypothetical protein